MTTALPLFQNMGTTIFEVMSRMAAEHGAINLGQGSPDEQAPEDILKVAADYLMTQSNQYPPMAGLPVLREAVAAHEGQHWKLDRTAMTDVVVTSGATEALAACILAYVSNGDEVIIFEPYYDAYAALIRLAGGVPVAVRLDPPNWEFTAETLKAALSPRTKAILINDPLNPAGKVYDQAELEIIADIAQGKDLLVISDSVYEHLTFDGKPYIPISTLPGMDERTLKVGSAGKIFSVTGWKVGWVTGPEALLKPVTKAHQFLTFTTAPNLQAAVAHGLTHHNDYVVGLKDVLQDRRDILKAGLSDVGFKVLHSQGTYFLSVLLNDTPWEGKDIEFCEWITKEARVAAVPNSVFYLENPNQSVARFCFAKTEATLREACTRLQRVKNG